MNSEQKRATEALLVILCCFGIFIYTYSLETHVYCDWTGLEIEERLGHEVTFAFKNGTRTHYCCINISLLAFRALADNEEAALLDSIELRCQVCGMLMDWNDPMVVWIYSTEYLNPTTHTPTIVGVCRNTPAVDLCEAHFLDEYGGEVIANPYLTET